MTVPLATNGAAAVDPRAACGKPPRKTGLQKLRTTDGNGTAREYTLLVPASYDARTPIALTFVYHGAGATEKDAEGFGLQDVPAAADASAFVFPRSIPFQSYGVGWDDRCGGYDMAFFDRMLAEVESLYCIDARRVFAAGFSWGGDHVASLACCRGSRVRAVAASSCTDEFSNPADFRTYANTPCPNEGTTAVRFTFDPGGDGELSAQLFKTTGELFRSLDRCGADTTRVSEACVGYGGCAEPFVACGYRGLGHALPPGWAADTWAFFSTFRGEPHAAP